MQVAPLGLQANRAYLRGFSWPKKPSFEPLAIKQVSKAISQILQRRLVQLQIRRGSRIRREEHPKPSHKRVPRRRFAAQVRHNTTHDHFLHPHPHQPLLQPRVTKRAVSILLYDLVRTRHQPFDLRQELGVGGAVVDQIAVPPLAEHAVVGGGLVAVAREENGDGGSSAELDGGESVVEYGFGYGGKVVLHVND